ncbi:riboflavin synthase [Halocola ammonii]
MFTGIVEALGKVEKLKKDGGNLDITLSCPFTEELKIDQSVAHNGVCLTVVSIDSDQTYTVTAIRETLNKSNLGEVSTGDLVNLERCMKLGDRLDGHMVQGHVDQTGTVKSIEEEDGSWRFTIKYSPQHAGNVTVEKGSVTINGTSLTVVDSKPDEFSVAIIPYTYNHTNFHKLSVGDTVNLEFDVIGKYVARMAQINLQEQAS